ncbi:restriction endonuclease [Paenibacillus polymyxa]|uniref:restriction endonuclease n=1 Tax=Paenibacillus polymyxa TaxID=1406 RepID=UPI0020256AAF|nr:restriction endonuclease [Paenibacillus polymyxa]WDZ57670.1 hypothetical protein MF625_07895 [Paenibacillus polymyxa]
MSTNMKLLEKVSDLIKVASQTFSDNVAEDVCNNARKSAEAISKAVIYNHFGEHLGTDIILGKKKADGTSVTSRIKELELATLSQIVTCENPRNSTIITNKRTRHRVASYLETVRTHGNPASHDPNSAEDFISIGHVNITKIAVVNLLKWFFEEYLEETIPTELNEVVKLLSNGETASTVIKELSNLKKFNIELKDWFHALDYTFDSLNIENDNFFVFVIKIPERRRTIDVLVYGVTSQIRVQHVKEVENLTDYHDCDEGWVVSTSNVTKAAKDYSEKASGSRSYICYNFDQLIEETIDLSNYFEWIETEITNKKIEKNYIPLYCEKMEIDERTKRFEAKNIYDEEDGGLERYIDYWQQDNQKEHISILGEFGTGKSWFCLYYTWKMIKKYKEAKKTNFPRPRIPILIHLRDYSKAMKVDTLISDFFFRLHKIEVKGAFSAFMQLNKMGKLLLIFDGFDEMADKVNKQKMIDNFWELASVINGSSKVVLSCRNEHFPQIKEGRSLLNAELKESTKFLTGESPQFEVLQLLKFNDEQIQKILSLHTNPEAVSKLINNEEIRDLLARPIMIDLIIDAIKDIEDNKPVDMARIYLYATQRKMERDIKQVRTFTSLADKLYFLCELSWEMISNDKLTINYKEFPNVINRLFNLDDKEIDYWRYDLRGQTILIIDEEDGNYKPAHKSFLEFFVAYKFAAELGILPDDFTECARLHINDQEAVNEDYTWSSYFNRNKIEGMKKKYKLRHFKQEDILYIIQSFGKLPLTKAILDIMMDIIKLDDEEVELKLLKLLDQCRKKPFEEVNYLTNNIVLLLLSFRNDYFSNKDLSDLSLRNFSIPSNPKYRPNKPEIGKKFLSTYGVFTNTLFDNCDLQNAELGNFIFERKRNIYAGASFRNANLKNFKFNSYQMDDLDIDEINKTVVLGSPVHILILDLESFQVKERVNDSAWNVSISTNKRIIAHSGWGKIKIRSIENLSLLKTLEIEPYINSNASETSNLWTGKFLFSKRSNILYAGCNNSYIYLYDLNSNKEIKALECFYNADRLSINHSENFLLSSGFDEFILWNLHTNEKVFFEKLSKEENDLVGFYAAFHPNLDQFAVSDEKSIRIFETQSQEKIFEISLEDCRHLTINGSGEFIAVSVKGEIFIYNYSTKELYTKFKIKSVISENSTIAEEDDDDYNYFVEEMKFNYYGTIIYILTTRQLLAVDICSLQLLNRYLHLDDLSGCEFINSSGLTPSKVNALKKNGAIF